MEACGLNEVTAMLESAAVTQDNTAGEHPRFSKYKNVKRAEELQQKRRQEFLRHQKEYCFFLFCVITFKILFHTLLENDERFRIFII